MSKCQMVSSELLLAVDGSLPRRLATTSCSGVLWNCTDTTTFPPASCNCLDVVSLQHDRRRLHYHFETALARRRPASIAEKKAVAPLLGSKISLSDWHPYWLLAYGLLNHLHVGGQGGSSTGRHHFWLEFGVFTGASTNITCGALASAGRPNARVAGFDSFEGLPEAWGNFAKGRFNLHGNMPPVRPCASLHKGLINASTGVLPKWIDQHPPTAVHLLGASIDVDLYKPAVDALMSLQRSGLLQAGSLLHMHEFVQPFTRADPVLYGPEARPTPSDMKARARMWGYHKPSDEEDALVHFLQHSKGSSVWLVPVHTDPSAPTLFVVVDPGEKG